MRTLKLPGASIYRDTNGTAIVWRVRLGKTFTGGKPVKKSFHAYGTAAKWLRDQEKARSEHGRGAFLLSDAQVAEAQNAFHRLAEASDRTGRKLGLTDAVTFFLRHGAPPGGKTTVRDAITRWLDEKAKNSQTRHGVQAVLNRFAEQFGGRPMNEISASDCQRFIDQAGVSANSKNHYARDLSTVFEWARKPGRQWLGDNPWLHITLPKKTPIRIRILTPIEAGKLLSAAAAQNGTPLLGSLTLGLFAGLRPAERARIDWSAVRLDAKQPFVEVRAEWAKTSARRTVELCPAALEWLKLVISRVGLVNPRNYEGRFAELCASVGITYPKNGLRHSYASYRYAVVRDAASVAADLGHDNLRTLKRHYVDVVDPDAARAYFEIRPIPASPLVFGPLAVNPNMPPPDIQAAC